MIYIIAAFRSRAHTMRFADVLKGYGVASGIINTPKEAGVGCGISVKFSESALERARLALMRSRYDTFAGFYTLEQKSGRNIVNKLS